MATITKFPVSVWQQIWNARGARAVNCVVSERWLSFGKLGNPGTGYLPDRSLATPIPVDVMTGDDRHGNKRKICKLVLTYEELKALVDRLEAERGGGATT